VKMGGETKCALIEEACAETSIVLMGLTHELPSFAAAHWLLSHLNYREHNNNQHPPTFKSP